MEAVGEQQSAFDLEDRDRRQPIPGVGVSLDGEIVQPIAEIQAGVEDEVVERHLADIHGGASFVVGVTVHPGLMFPSPTLWP